MYNLTIILLYNLRKYFQKLITLQILRWTRLKSIKKVPRNSIQTIQLHGPHIAVTRPRP